MYQVIPIINPKKITKIAFGLFSIFIPIFINSSASLATSNVEYNISVGSSLSLEISNNTVSMILNPASKTFDTKDLGITVGTNYINGYNLYIDSDSTNLTNSEYTGTSYTIGTLTGSTTTGDFPAGYWGYRISSGDTGDDDITDTSTQSDNTNYYEFVPNTLVSSSPTAINNNATTLTFATKIDYTKPAGLYTNTFTFSAIVNPVTYSITYTDTTEDSTVANLPSPNPQTGMISGGAATLSSTVPTRDGYTFKSWCQGTVSDSGTTCTGTEYSAGGSLPISSTVGPEVAVTLNATWEEDILYLQNVTASDCITTPTLAYDNRDGQEYVIQKLADNKCWMMTNLNLGATTLSTDLTSSNTNLSTTVTASTFNGWKKSSGSNTYTAGEYIVQTGTDSNNGLPYGTLYNYCAASAGTICTSSNSNSASYDICPAGWRLPTGGSSGEFQTLYGLSAYNTNAKMRASYEDGGAAFTLAGQFGSSTPTSQGIFGLYWSSTRFSNADMYRLYLNTSYVYPADYYGRYDGYSIRCILK